MLTNLTPEFHPNNPRKQLDAAAPLDPRIPLARDETEGRDGRTGQPVYGNQKDSNSRGETPISKARWKKKADS